MYKQFGTVVDIPIVADVAIGVWWGNKLELSEEQVYDEAFVQEQVRKLNETRREG